MADPARAALAALAALTLAAATCPAALAAPDERFEAAVPPPAPADGLDAADLALPLQEGADDLGELAPAEPSATVRRLARWAVASGDSQGLPFAIVDKPSAQVAVYDASGVLLGSGPALLGIAVGDDSAPGVGEMALSKIPMDERTTPAGRFLAFYGPAAGEKHPVLWVDFDDAISMHPVITSKPAELRPQRLATPSPTDNRISHGCINVSDAFYRRVVKPTFARSKGVVYVLPDIKPLSEVFPAFAAEQAALDAGLPDPDGPDVDVLASGADPAAIR